MSFDVAGFYPESVITTRFGWDATTFPGAPRIHHAVDRAGPGIVRIPFDADRVEWHDADAQGNSVLRAFADGGAMELRMLHFLPGELSAELRESIKHAREVPRGTPIGPVGNKGIAVAAAGGTGRHVHYSLMLMPGFYDDQLDEVAPGWRLDRTAEFSRLYGSHFVVERTRRAIRWMNDKVICKGDPWTNAERLVVDSATIFGL